MKKILLFVSTVIGAATLNAQSSIEVKNADNGNVISNNQIFSEDVAAGGDSHLNFTIKNTSGSSKVYGLERVDNVLNPGADTYFCFGGQCYGHNILVSPTTVTVSAGATSVPQQAYFYEDGTTAGYTEVTYKVYDVNNTSDASTFVFKFNPLLASVKENNSLFASVSELYPNPSNHSANIKVRSYSNVEGVSITVSNALGSVVSMKKTDLSTGDNKIIIDTDNLPSGIYFVTISSYNSKVVKKFTVNK